MKRLLFEEHSGVGEIAVKNIDQNNKHLGSD